MFKLNEMPESYQLSIRISNLISCYGSKIVFEMLHSIEKESGVMFDDSTMKFDKREESEMLYIQLIQMKRHHGGKAIKSYVKTVYTKAA